MDKIADKTENDKSVENYHQGLFITETILGNPNGSFMENEPRNISGRIFTTDKVIKYNIRNYLKQKFEEIKMNNEGEIKEVENFVFFYPRKTEDAEEGEASYLTNDSVFERYFDNDFQKILTSCPDVRMFGGTFSFQEENRAIYGPIQLSYGIDLIGAEIVNTTLGTPFSTKNGKQTTEGQDYLVDHAVIGYDITINPNNEDKLLKESDLKKFREGIIKGTNLRKSTSKKTNAKVLLIVKFEKGFYPNIGDLKTVVKVESEKISEEDGNKSNLVLNFDEVKKEMAKFEKKIKNIELYKARDVKIKNFNELGRKKVQTEDLSSF